VFSVESSPRLYKENPRPAKLELSLLKGQSKMIETKGKKGIKLSKEYFIFAVATVGQL
jgi:hypothetical protein